MASSDNIECDESNWKRRTCERENRRIVKSKRNIEPKYEKNSHKEFSNIEKLEERTWSNSWNEKQMRRIKIECQEIGIW